MKHSSFLCLTLWLCMLFLSSCGSAKTTENTQTQDTKSGSLTAFSYTAKNLDSFPREYVLEKTGRLTAKTATKVTSQGIGRIEFIWVQEGSQVKKWQVIARLQDTTANYDLRLSQAKNTLATTRNTIQSTKIMLDKAVADAELALKRSKNDSLSAQESAKKSIEKAKRDAQKSKIASGSTTDAMLTLNQLQGTLQKAETEYKNLLASNQQTIQNYQSNYRAFSLDLKKLVGKLVYEGDKLYGFTSKYQTENATVRQYIGASSTSSKTLLLDSYTALTQLNTTLDWLTFVDQDLSQVLTQFELLQSQYQVVRAYLQAASKHLENSITGVSFPQSQLDGYISQNNGYKNELSALENTWVVTKNAAALFLANYKNTENTALQGLEIQKQTLSVQERNLQTSEFEAENTLGKLEVSTKQTIDTANIAFETAKLQLDTALKNRVVTLEKLALSEKDALLAIDQAEEELSKLTIIAPIAGSITQVLWVVWSEVSPGSPIVELASSQPEIVFELEAWVVPLVPIGSFQQIRYLGTTLTGTVTGVSQVATDSLLYTARISVQGVTPLIGQVATITLPIPTKNPVVPLDILRVVSDKKAEITSMSDGPQKSEVQLIRIIGSFAEIQSSLPWDTQVITSSLMGYDSKKHILTPQ